MVFETRFIALISIQVHLFVSSFLCMCVWFRDSGFD
jgi:hypothetical protein